MNKITKYFDDIDDDIFHEAVSNRRTYNLNKRKYTYEMQAIRLRNGSDKERESMKNQISLILLLIFCQIIVNSFLKQRQQPQFRRNSAFSKSLSKVQGNNPRNFLIIQVSDSSSQVFCFTSVRILKNSSLLSMTLKNIL